MSKEDGWMPVHATIVDLTNIADPRDLDPMLGVCLHVNESENGTPDGFFRAAGTSENPFSVIPTVEIYKSRQAGGTHQFLPLLRRPWCQMDGDVNYNAAECAGYTGEDMTGYQIDALAWLCARMHFWYGMELRLADKPGEPGLITHHAGGAAWGGHPCPGRKRTRERREVLVRAQAKVDYMRHHGRNTRPGG